MKKTFGLRLFLFTILCLVGCTSCVSQFFNHTEEYLANGKKEFIICKTILDEYLSIGKGVYNGFPDKYLPASYAYTKGYIVSEKPISETSDGSLFIFKAILETGETVYLLLNNPDNVTSFSEDYIIQQNTDIVSYDEFLKAEERKGKALFGNENIIVTDVFLNNHITYEINNHYKATQNDIDLIATFLSTYQLDLSAESILTLLSMNITYDKFEQVYQISPPRSLTENTPQSLLATTSIVQNGSVLLGFKTSLFLKEWIFFDNVKILNSNDDVYSIIPIASNSFGNKKQKVLSDGSVYESAIYPIDLENIDEIIDFLSAGNIVIRFTGNDRYQRKINDEYSRNLVRQMKLVKELAREFSK